MIKGFVHVGLSVADLDRSIAFYRDVVGMDVEVDTTFSGELYETIMGLEGTKGRVAVVKAANMELELFEFHHPPPTPGDPDRPVSDQGITHFCFEVDDIDAVHARLEAGGVRFNCPPLRFFDEAIATYARDPDGNVFEILQWLQPKAR